MIKIEIFKLFGSIFVDNSKANQSISATDKKAEGLAKRLGSGIKTAAKWGSVITGAATAVGGAMFAASSKVANTAKEINKFSQITGMSREGFQEWDYIMKSFGYSAEQASGDLAALGEKAMDAANGVGEGAELFGMLGVQVTDASGKLKSQEQIFNDVILSLQSMEDVTKRNAIASALLSTTGEELVPILNMTSEELSNMKNQAHELGIVMDDSSISTGVKFSESVNKIKTALGGFVNQIIIAVMPTMQRVADWVVSNMPKITAVFEYIGEVTGIVFKYMKLIIGDVIGFLSTNIIEPFIQWLSSVWTISGEDISRIAEQAWNFIVGVFTTAFDIIKQVFGIFKQAFQGDWEGAWESVKQLAADIWNTIPVLFEEAFNLLLGIADLIMTQVINIIRSIFGDTVGDIFQTAWDGVKTIWEAQKEALLGIWQAFTAVFQGDWGTAWEEIKNAFNTIWSAITSIFAAPFEKAKEIVGNLITDIGTWMNEKLEAIFAPAKKIIDDVGGWFFRLYDRVVGHSYIPDMVNEIGEATARLKEKLNQPVKDSTEEAGEDFKDFGEYVVDETEKTTETVADKWASVLDTISGGIGDFVVNTTTKFVSGSASWQNIFTELGVAFGNITKSIFGDLAKEMIKNLITQGSWLATTLANIATAVTAFLGQAFAALTAFFWFLGPFAPAAAGGVIAAALAAIAALGISIGKSLFGGGGATTPPPVTDPGGSDPGSGSGSDSGSDTTANGSQVINLTGNSRDFFADLLRPWRDITSMNIHLESIDNQAQAIASLLKSGNFGTAVAGAGGGYVIQQMTNHLTVANNTTGYDLLNQWGEIADTTAKTRGIKK